MYGCRQIHHANRFEWEFFEMNGSLKALTTYYKCVIRHKIVTIKVSYVKTRYNVM